MEFNADVDNSNLWTVNDFGTFRTNATKDGNDYFVYGGENLRITEITPFEDREYSKVTYSTYANSVALNSGSETIKNNSATIPADMYSGDTIRVNVNFNAVSNYSVQDARYMNGSKYYANYKGIDKHGNKVYSKIVKGNEIWVHTRNGTIQNGGSNGRNYKYHKMGGKK